MLFILRGATLALTRLITGRTQVPGLRVLIENDPIAWLFATDTFKWFFIWLGSMNLIDLRTDGTPLATGIPPSVIWFVYWNSCRFNNFCYDTSFRRRVS
jgi:simple sugar transport system permease protein